MEFYKKVSDLEQVTEVKDGATVPVLDGDGVMKRISAAGIGSGATTTFFKISNSTLTPYENNNVFSTLDEVLDAYFGGTAYVYNTNNPGCTDAPQKITGFVLSGNVYVQANRNDNYGTTMYKINGATLSDAQTAFEKYLP